MACGGRRWQAVSSQPPVDNVSVVDIQESAPSYRRHSRGPGIFYTKLFFPYTTPINELYNRITRMHAAEIQSVAQKSKPLPNNQVIVLKLLPKS